MVFFVLFFFVSFVIIPNVQQICFQILFWSTLKTNILCNFVLFLFLFRSKKELDHDEYMFFLTGGVGLENKLANPAPTWLTDKSWDELCRLADLKAYKKLRYFFDFRFFCFFTFLYYDCNTIQNSFIVLFLRILQVSKFNNNICSCHD